MQLGTLDCFDVDRKTGRPGNSNVLQGDFSHRVTAELMECNDVISNPMAQTFRDQVSGGQIRAAQQLAEESGVDLNNLASNVFLCEFAELSRRAAERLIEILRYRTEYKLAEMPAKMAG